MSVLSEENQQLLEKYLVEEGVISQVKLESVKEKANANSAPILATLVDEAQVSNEVLTKLMAKINHVPYVNLQAVDFLSSRIGRPLKVYTASEEGIIKVIKQYDEDIEADVTSTVGSISSAATEEAQQIKEAANAPTNSNIKTIIQDSPISKALSAILEYAARTRASDIHIEPLEHELKIRCRVDGVLREIMKLPKSTEPPLISRIKILSNLKIDEHRIPQDGQFTVDVEGNLIDLRIAISPVIWGEQVVIRLLDKSGTSLKLEDMGYTGRALRTIKKGVAQSNGMILTSGPTGSGKSTSMYALIQEIKNDTINIVTD